MKIWEQFIKENSPRCYHTVIGNIPNKDDLRVSVDGNLYRQIQADAVRHDSFQAANRPHKK